MPPVMISLSYFDRAANAESASTAIFGFASVPIYTTRCCFPDFTLRITDEAG